MNCLGAEGSSSSWARPWKPAQISLMRSMEGFSPRKVFRLAVYALGDRYDKATLHRWLGNFYRRFFAQQFKRSCLPDGPKVGSVTLSPRGDWRMPSDAVARLWLEEWEDLA